MDIKMGHIFAMIIVLLVIEELSDYQTTKILNTNTDIDFKLDSLLDFRKDTINTSGFDGKTSVVGLIDINPLGYNVPPKFMYLDANLITLFYDFKNDFYQFNPEAYIKAIQSTNNLLEIRSNFEIQLVSPVVVPNLQDNFAKTYKLTKSDEPIGTRTLINAYPMYFIAEKQYKLALNYITSFIVSLPSEPVMHLKHQEVTNKAQILLKRNLDIIYKIYSKKKDPGDSFITDYDDAQPMNLVTGDTGINDNEMNSNFNFY